MSKSKIVFTAQRFGNWCQKKAQWDKEQEDSEVGEGKTEVGHGI